MRICDLCVNTTSALVASHRCLRKVTLSATPTWVIPMATFSHFRGSSSCRRFFGRDEHHTLCPYTLKRGCQLACSLRPPVVPSFPPEKRFPSDSWEPANMSPTENEQMSSTNRCIYPNSEANWLLPQNHGWRIPSFMGSLQAQVGLVGLFERFLPLLRVLCRRRWLLFATTS